MAKDRRAEAIWIDTRQRWQINAQRDGKRKTFTSSIPGRRGKHEAEAKADDWLDAGQPDDMRFDAAWAIYLDYLKRNTGTANHYAAETIGRNWILDAEDATRISRKRLSKIKLKDLQELVTAAGEAGRARRTCKNIKDKLSGFFHYAENQGWEYSVDPSKIVLPTQAKVGKRKVVQPDALNVLFTMDTVQKNGQTIPCFYVHAFRFLVVTGYRRGELCGFMRSDYDAPVLTVNRSINDHNEITQGKNANARRTNVLSKRAQQILADQQAMLNRLGIDSPWLFPGRDGEHLDPRTLYNYWLRIYAKQHGITASLHELRHTFVSIARIEMPEALLKDFVGHSVSMDTFGIYGHEIDGDKQRAADIIDAVFDRVLAPKGTQ